MTATVRQLVEVAVPLPVRRRFTYVWPAGHGVPLPGQRVQVPFGRRRLTGVVAQVDPEAPGGDVHLRQVSAVLDEEPILPRVVMELARFAAGYYVVAEGEMLRAALPAGLTGAGRQPGAAPTRTVLTLAGSSADWPAYLEELGRAPAQARAVTLLIARGGRSSQAELVAEGVTAATCRALRRKPWLHAVAEVRPPAAPVGLAERRAGRLARLTNDQQAAFHKLQAAVHAAQAGTFMLHGVTGSGKTEVYLRAAAAALEAGRQVLILVPEIGLTPALVADLSRRFGTSLAVLHSGLSLAQRRSHWQKARCGDARVVVGARSAIFAPLRNVGLIVVDEEHDSSYKQDESPRYHARDLAVVRGRLESCPVVLASATPAMETWQRVLSGRDHLLSLPQRVQARPLPPFEIVDLRQEFRETGKAGLFSRQLLQALQQVGADGGQAMLLLNRRGWAAFILCRACGEPVSCRHCSVSMTLHRDRGRLVCHYCGDALRTPRRCPGCGEEALQEMGAGTERIEDELSSQVPGLRSLRMDADAVRQVGGHGAILKRFAAGEADVLIGTQMIAKGHDFPGVTLVGILSGDAALGFPDFRAAEWTFQLVTQAAGRAGRGQEPGRVILQAFQADHYALQRAAAHDFHAFQADEDRYRQALLYPPHAMLAAVRVRHRDFASGDRLVTRLAERLRRDPDCGDHVRILGPAPAPLARIRGQYRFHILLKSSRRRRLTAILGRLADGLEGESRHGGHVALDVDPVSLM